MIAYLEGKLRHKSPEYLVLDVQGVGYCVHVPLSTFYELPEPGRTAALNIHTHVREDLIQLYGFRSFEEKEMFLHLITINGVGPRLASPSFRAFIATSFGGRWPSGTASAFETSRVSERRSPSASSSSCGTA